MTCYVVPATAALVHYFMRKKISSCNTKHQLWLNQLFLGGAIFGFVDHLWNGELFLFGKNILTDLALGATITLVIMVVWGYLVLFDRLAKRNIQTSKS